MTYTYKIMGQPLVLALDDNGKRYDRLKKEKIRFLIELERMHNDRDIIVLPLSLSFYYAYKLIKREPKLQSLIYTTCRLLEGIVIESPHVIKNITSTKKEIENDPYTLIVINQIYDYE